MEKSIINLLIVISIIIGLYIIVHAPKSIEIKIEFKNFKIEIDTKKE